MSDNSILIVPCDPLHIPSASTQSLVADCLRRLMPSATRIELSKTPNVQFFDCGANLERVSCPHCASEMTLDWWHARMDDDFHGEGFGLGDLVTPCCGKPSKLNELHYDWPQAFGCFSWNAANANIGALSEIAIAELERVAGVPLQLIYQRR
jgi:hypothetical protein